MNLEDLGKTVLLFSLVLLLIGSFLYFFGKFLGLQRLPGDIFYKKGNFSFYFPLGTSIIVSIIATIILNVLFLIIKNR